MKVPRNVSGREVAKALTRLGYAFEHETGSHIRVATDRNGKHVVTIPDHEYVKIGTLNSILRDVAGHHRMTKSELIDLLFG